MKHRLCPVDEKKCLGMKFHLHRKLKILNTNSKFFCLIVAVEYTFFFFVSLALSLCIALNKV